MDRDLAADLIRNSKISEFADELIARLRPSVRIRTERYRSEPLHDSSTFGGLPLLPDDCEWPHWDASASLRSWRGHLEENLRKNPRSGGALKQFFEDIDNKLRSPHRPMAFLAQLKLSELSQITDTTLLPPDGRLLFFRDIEEGTRSFDPASRGSARVLYVKDSEPCSPRKPPGGVPDDFITPPCALNFSLEQTLPSDARSYGLDLHVWDDVSPYRALIEDLIDQEEPIHRVGGYSESVQGNMELECQLVTNGIWLGGPEGYNDPRRAMLEPGASDWRLILQLDSDENAKWMWGDAGRVYFWIRKQDLASRDFSYIWCVEQCY